MKIAPHNQTLILASERAPAGRSQNTPGKASNVSSAIAPRDRVTIVAARADATVVYLQADYDEQSDDAAHSDYAAHSTYALSDGVAQSDDTPQSGSALVQSAAMPRQNSTAFAGQRDIYGNPRSTSSDAGFYSRLNPADRYARTQRILAEEPEEFVHIDVHA